MSNPRITTIECNLSRTSLATALDAVPVLDGIPYAAYVGLTTGRIVVMETDGKRQPAHAEYLDALVENGYPEWLYTTSRGGGVLYHITYAN
jgi:hypothetical protein